MKALDKSLAVEGLPLTNLTVAYYYVEYGTVLAFLSRPTQNYCPEALAVLNEVRAQYSSDPMLMSIVEDSEGICRRLASEAQCRGKRGPPRQALRVRLKQWRRARQRLETLAYTR